MLKNSLLILMLLAISPWLQAAEPTDDNRVVLAMPDHFHKIVANGDMTVEIIFNKDHKGYVVYHAADSLAPKIHCNVDSTATLHISGSQSDNSVISRIVVLACDSVTSVVNTGSGSVLIKEMPRVDDFCAISSGSGSIKCREINALHIMLSDNGSASVKVKEAKGRFIDIYGNGSGSIGVVSMLCHGTRILNNSEGAIDISELKSRRGEIINNANGEVTVSGKARAFAVVNYSSGKINVAGFKCKKISEANYGSGTIISNK